MNPDLEARLRSFEQDEDWAGMSPEDMRRVTVYTLEAIQNHLRAEQPHARVDINIIDQATDLVNTLLED